MPLAIFAVIALAHRPAFPASPVPLAPSQPYIEGQEGQDQEPEDPGQCDPGPEAGPPAKVSPFSCRAPRQSPNLEVPPEPEWWSKLTLPDLPIERPWEVQAAIARIVDSPKRRLLIRAALERSGAFAPQIIADLAARKLPRALVALPLLESAYSETATSRAGAVGLWQLMPGTARKLGLAVTASYDERRNPERSTAAALEHLEDLFAHFGNWELALAAYDRGEPGVKRALRKAGVPDYWSLVDMRALPDETRDYVPTFLALAIIYENAEHFGLDGPRAPPRSIAVLEVPIDTPLALIARAAGTSLLGLRRASPELVSGDTVPADHVCIPASGLSRARVMLPHLLAAAAEHEINEQSPEYDWGHDDGGPIHKKKKHRAPHVPDDYGPEPEPSAKPALPAVAKLTSGTPKAPTQTKLHKAKPKHPRSAHGAH